MRAKAPCKHCEKLAVGCKTECSKWKAYRDQKEIEDKLIAEERKKYRLFKF